MVYSTLISPENLHKHVYDPHWYIFDCRFALADPEQGRRDYEKGHISGARYADLDKDLCGPIRTRPGGFTETAVLTGRHPLPDVDTFVATLNRWGVTNNTQVVAYDDKGGGLAAARLWWMLRWVGHDPVAVLDGGWQGWIGKQYPVSSGQYSVSSEQLEVSRQLAGKPFRAQVRPELLATTEDVQAMMGDPERLIVDSRTPERYRGEIEPIDPVAGRIPGAANVAYGDTQTANGFFRPAQALKEQFEQLLDNVSPQNTVFYCGSGVTAAASLLAMKHAGLGDGKLYAGSWSEWIADPNRPIEKG